MKYDTIPSLKRGALDKIVRYLNFNVDINWEHRRYQIVKDLLSNDFDGRRMNIDEVDNAIFTADLIINRLKTI